jgi:glycosyltransferase involved in cell wall biosynthesis
MNILIVHNTYQRPGGEDVVVAQESSLLERNGNRVTSYRRSNDEINDLSLGQRLGLITRIVSARDSQIAIRSILRDAKPDLVHVHNTFLMVSPSVYEACWEEGVPVVQTLHNYRLLCPLSTFYRDAGPCEECVTHSLLRSVQHACYHDSRLMSAAIALLLKTHHSRQTWHRKIDSYIAISDFVREKYIEGGFPAGKINVKPNFVDPDPGERDRPGDYALFVGRLMLEKGLLTLLEAWKMLPTAVPLIIVGDGPMRHRLEAQVAREKIQAVRFTGQLKREATYDAMRKAAFLVVPSVWNEPFGMVVAEAFACGTPVLGAFAGSIPEMIDDHVTGLQFASGDADALAKKVAWARDHLPEMAVMGKAARRIYEQRYTAKQNYGRLIDIYERAIDTHARINRDRLLRAAA